MRKPLMTAVSAGILVGVLVLAGCSAGESQDHQGHDSGSMASSAGAMSDSPMDHPMDGGPAPAGIKAVSAPKFPIGSQVMLTADHMAGMDGARSTIVGAFDTYTYSVNFTPTTGGQPVKDHKWVVQQEIKNAGDRRLADGTEVTLEADHMTGMKGAKATIASSTDQTVYMVDYEADGMKMTNHKWVVESEIQPTS